MLLLCGLEIFKINALAVLSVYNYSHEQKFKTTMQKWRFSTFNM